VLVVGGFEAAPAAAQAGTTATPNPGWLTQPVATVMTGVLAVTTALIALAGVLLTRRTSERQFAQKQELERSHFAQSHELERVEGMRKRYTTCAEQLAHSSSAVRQAGVYALAALAGDWNNLLAEPETTDGDALPAMHEEARVCLDLLCAYLRSSTAEEDKDVRQSIVSVIRRHARQWLGYRYDLRQADLNGADLNGANLVGAYLIEANLTGADLNTVNLSNAYLSGIVFNDAHLSGADSSSAYLNGADLSSADLSGVAFNDATRWPDGFTPPSSSPSRTSTE
jgi:hypothetical protein